MGRGPRFALDQIRELGAFGITLEVVELLVDLFQLEARARKIERFLSQPFFVAQQFTGRSGKYVPLKETVAGFKEILSGALDDLPEQAFYMVGNIEEAKEAAAKLKSQAA